MKLQTATDLASVVGVILQQDHHDKLKQCEQLIITTKPSIDIINELDEVKFVENRTDLFFCVLEHPDENKIKKFFVLKTWQNNITNLVYRLRFWRLNRKRLTFVLKLFIEHKWLNPDTTLPIYYADTYSDGLIQTSNVPPELIAWLSEKNFTLIFNYEIHQETYFWQLMSVLIRCFFISTPLNLSIQCFYYYTFNLIVNPYASCLLQMLSILSMFFFCLVLNCDLQFIESGVNYLLKLFYRLLILLI